MSPDARAGALIDDLERLEPIDAVEHAAIETTIGALESLERPFDEGAQPEHVTASAFALSTRGIVLIRHRLLGIWLQPGGHVDPGEEPVAAAIRELREETGLEAHVAPCLLVQCDVHDGPRGHRHFDCRWLFATDPSELSPHAGESTELGWFGAAEAFERCDPSLRTGLAKAQGVAREALPEIVASWPHER